MMNISRGKLAVLGVALVVGGWLGYASNRAFAGGGIGAIGGFGGVAITGLILVVLAFIAVISARQPDGKGGPAARVTIVAAALLVAGFGGGWLGAVALQRYEPVQLEASGRMGLSLDGLSGYAGQDEALAACRSGAGSESVVWVDADAAGRIGADGVYVSLSMFPANPGIRPAVVVSLVPIVKGPGAAPQWSGTADLVQGVDGDRSGRATFAALTLDGDESGGQPAGWPLELSGSLSWSCGDWSR